jgi:hypothetical protein
VRRVRTTMLAVATVICLAALLTPVVSAKGPPAPSVTLFTLTGAGASGDYCMFAVTIDYAGHLSKGVTLKVYDNVTPDFYTGGPISHHIDHTFQFGAGFEIGDFVDTNNSTDFTLEIDGTVMAVTTPFAGTGSCPTGTYSYSS